MSSRDEERHRRGWDTLTAVSRTDDPQVVRRVAELAPDLARFIVEFGYGDVYSRATLEPQRRQLLTIAALASMGGCEPQLDVHVATALNVGVAPDEIVESVMHVLPFCGFPRALNALEVVRRVFERRGVWTTDEWRGAPAGAQPST